MKQYLSLLRDVRDNGIEKTDRTGTGTLSLFGAQLRYDLAKGFPLATTRKMFLKGIIAELLWFLSGDTNVRALQKQGVHIWDAWADENGSIGRGYPAQWVAWAGKDGQTINQIHNVIEQIKVNPDSRRLIVSAWNVGELDDMALPPCHTLFQFYVANGRLSCQLFQRSSDLFTAGTWNASFYALLTMMVAQVTGLKVGEFIHSFGDAHIYLNHLDQVDEQLERTPFELPRMSIEASVTDIFSFKRSDFIIRDYQYHDPIRAEIAV